MNNLEIIKYETDDKTGVYFNKKLEPSKFARKTERLNNIIQEITREPFMNVELYLKVEASKNKYSKIKLSADEKDEDIKIKNSIYERFEPDEEIISLNSANKKSLELRNFINNKKLFKYLHQTEKHKNCKNICYTQIEDNNSSDKRNCKENDNLYYMCLCSEDDCKNLSAVRHIKTGKVFMFGSKCVGKICGDLQDDINNLHKNYDGNCENCLCKLFINDYKDNKKNYDNYGENGEGGENNYKNKLCVECYIEKNITDVVQKHYRLFKEEPFEFISKYVKHIYKCQNAKCKVPLHFKSSNYYDTNAKTNDKTYCNSCRYEKEKEKNEETKKKLEAERLHKYELERIRWEQIRKETLQKQEKMKIKRQEIERENNRLEKEKAERNLKTIDYIIKKTGFYDNKRIYEFNCNKCKERCNIFDLQNKKCKKCF